MDRDVLGFSKILDDMIYKFLKEAREKGLTQDDYETILIEILACNGIEFFR